jgi:heptosyltransferase-2
MSEATHILVFLPNWVGDVVMATPVLRSLREGFPESRIVYFGRKIALDVLAGNTWADASVVDESRNKPRAVHFLRTAKQLARCRADVALLLPNSFRSALLARLGRATRRVGYGRDGRSWLLTDRLVPPRDAAGKFLPRPMIDYYADILRQGMGLEVASRKMALPVRPVDIAAAEQLLDEARSHTQNTAGDDCATPLVMLNPGASFGTSKLWPVERYAALADELIERRGARIIINASPSPAERNLAWQVEQAMTHKPLVNFARLDNSLGLLKGMMSLCDLLVTNDTGARHIAAAMGTAVVTIFGSTDPRWAQIDYPMERIVRADVPCSPCQQKFCPLPSGPGHHCCMQAISVEAVRASAMELLRISQAETKP